MNETFIVFENKPIQNLNVDLLKISASRTEFKR